MPPSVTLKHQAYRHVDHLELMAVEEVKRFVNYWRYDMGLCEQRGGWMYGYYREDSHYLLGIRAVCEAIYEPPQACISDVVSFLHDPQLVTADRLAAGLGLERIGWIFTHLPRDELLTAQELTQAARYQLELLRSNHFSRYPVTKFVTCTITTNDKGEPTPNAFMISDMGMALLRDGLLADPPPDTTHVMVRAAKEAELLPQVLESGKETTKFDADWLVVRVNESAPIKVRSLFTSPATFPCENRKNTQQPAQVKAFLRATANSNLPLVERVCNFHFLLYLSHLFDGDTALAVAHCVRDRTEIEGGMAEILNSIG